MFDSFSHTDPAPQAPALSHAQGRVNIFQGRSGFESGITHLIESASIAAGECAVLAVALSGPALLDPEANRKTLGLAANILRARVEAGALAYLGDGRFAVMLQGVSGRDAVAYCRKVLKVLDEIRLHWQGEVLTVESWIGGVMVEAHHDGMTLLEAAEHASEMALRKPGRKLHMVHEQQDASISVFEEVGEQPASPRTRGHAINAGLAAR